jgi:RNA polymerase sigma factor (sigma-70 family)
MTSAQSISVWIEELKAGDSNAAQQLWERYAAQLVELARHRLRHSPRRASDEEDVAASVFESVCRGAAAGRFQNVKNRDDLWWLLLAITRRKAIDHLRREWAQKRGASQTVGQSAFNTGGELPFSLDQLASDEPSPAFMAMLSDQHGRLLGLLRDDRLRRIAVARIEGYTIAEIADMLGISVRSVERKLRLIRDVWAKELN